jgi:hypothetical protein
MAERRRGNIEQRATAAQRMETLLALSFPQKSPAGALGWRNNINSARIRLASGILRAPREELVEALGVFEEKIAGTKDAFMRIALEGTVKDVFAQAGLNILRKKRKITAAKEELQKRK